MRSEKGSALVEAALIISFLLILVLGIADLGRALSVQINLQDAVSEGALFATKTPNDPAAIRSRVVDAADMPLTLGDVTIACPDAKLVEVSATYDVPMLTFVGQWFGSSITVTRSAVATVITSDTCVTS